MSLNVYFKPEIENSPNLKKDSYKDGSDKWSIGGLSLYRDDGSLYAMLGQLDRSRVPAELEQYVDEFSLYEGMPAMVRRETGRYNHATAEAKLELYESGKTIHYRVRIVGKKLEDVSTLLEMIKVGSIRPDESYEGSQSGMSRADLEAELERTRKELESVCKELALSYAQFHQAQDGFHSACDKNVEFRELANTLHEEVWPLCTKERAVRMIREVLDKKGSFVGVI